MQHVLQEGWDVGYPHSGIACLVVVWLNAIAKAAPVLPHGCAWGWHRAAKPSVFSLGRGQGVFVCQVAPRSLAVCSLCCFWRQPRPPTAQLLAPAQGVRQFLPRKAPVKQKKADWSHSLELGAGEARLNAGLEAHLCQQTPAWSCPPAGLDGDCLCQAAGLGSLLSLRGAVGLSPGPQSQVAPTDALLAFCPHRTKSIL